MKSHTVPRKLLEQFAYFDQCAQSLRLWRYEKGRPPRWDASPRTATRIDGHFNHPDIAAKESELEERLAREFEEPVNKFLFENDGQNLVLTDERRRQLTQYVTLLFSRSEARRSATRHLQQVSAHALNCFLSNEVQVLTVATKLNIDLIDSHEFQGALISPQLVRSAALRLLPDYETERNRQAAYAESIERAMAFLDEIIYLGTWHVVRTPVDDPFAISDAPVVTWERLEQPGLFAYGLGFHRPNVEVFLPISPTVCIHILPKVERTRQIEQPSTREVIIAQAAFAGRYCFTNIRSELIEEIMQQNFGRAKLGVKSFTVWHRNYDNAVYEILMNGGKWVEPPRR